MESAYNECYRNLVEEFGQNPFPRHAAEFLAHCSGQASEKINEMIAAGLLREIENDLLALAGRPAAALAV